MIIELQYYKNKQKLSARSQNNLNVQHNFSQNLSEITYKTNLSISKKIETSVMFKKIQTSLKFSEINHIFLN